MIYIDAEQLQDGLYNIKDGKIYKYKAKGGTVRTHKLENRPQGEWVRYMGDIWTCTACGESLMCDDIKCNNYCPNCGAKMKQ